MSWKREASGLDPEAIHLTFSVQSFVSLVLGGPTVENAFVSFIGATEGFLGGFMIALFVFTLTRSIAR